MKPRARSSRPSSARNGDQVAKKLRINIRKTAYQLVTHQEVSIDENMV